MTEKYYNILGLNANARLEDIKKAYRQKAKLYHPDVNKSPDAHEKFILLSEAYEYLHKLKSEKVSKSSTHYHRRKASQQAYEQWIRNERAKAQERAREHARMKWEEYKKTDHYKNTEAVNTAIDFLMLLTFLFVLIGIPIIAYSVQGKSGFWVSGIILIITSPIWIHVFSKKNLIKPKVLLNAFIRLVKIKTAQIALAIFVNIFIVFRIGLSTLIPIWVLLLLIAGSIFIGWLLSNFSKTNIRKEMLMYGIAPGLISLFLLINFLFSNNLVTETYRFNNHTKVISDGKVHYRSSTYIYLENNAYKKYKGIRVHLNV